MNLVTDSFQRMNYFLTIAWQQKLIMLLTNRLSLFHLPDVSRSATCSVLSTFCDKDRVLLIREMPGAFQYETQKAHWAQNASGKCSYCQEQDGSIHRLLHCPAFHETSQPYLHVLQSMQETDHQQSSTPWFVRQRFPLVSFTLIVDMPFPRAMSTCLNRLILGG